MSQIINAEKNSDWNTLLILMLQLKTSSGEFGFTEISNLAEVVHSKISNEHYDNLLTHILSFNTLYERVIVSPLPKKAS